MVEVIGEGSVTVAVDVGVRCSYLLILRDSVSPISGNFTELANSAVRGKVPKHASNASRKVMEK